MSGSIFDWEPKPKEWYDSLPPLVKRGEDREAVIARIVEDWTTDLGETDPDKHIAKFKAQFGRSPVVENLAFVQEQDDGTTAPIDLGEIARAVETRLTREGTLGEFLSTRYILIRGCRVDACAANELHIHPGWKCVGCLVGEGASFNRSVFGNDASFKDSIFGDGARFHCSTFGDRSRFDRSTFGMGATVLDSSFGDGACFDRSTFGDGAHFDHSTFGDKASFDGSRFGDGASFRRAVFGDATRFYRSHFGGGANFDGAKFGEGSRLFRLRFGEGPSFERVNFGNKSRFLRVTLGDGASFEHSTFSSGTRFDDSTFGEGASFNGSSFGDGVRFHNSTFDGGPSFDGAKFGNGVSFERSAFGDEATFESVTFGDMARFDRSRFGSEAWFGNSTFGDEVRFFHTTFGEEVWFYDTVFGDRPSFVGSTFGDWASFEGSTFGGEPKFRRVRFRGRCNMRGLAWGNRPKLLRAMLDWSRVRSLGALPVLTRISYLSLLVVPLLAGAWNAVSFYMHLSTPLSPAWAVAFFAALFVSLGHLAYQLKAPQVIREKSRDDLLAQRLAHWANATEREQRDLLQRACDAIQAVARFRPWDRNPNLVRRYGEVVWIPGTLEELDAFAEWEKNPDPDLDEAIERASSAEEHDAIEAERERRPCPRFTHEELRQIVIDEGAKAEFDAAARETPGWCAVSAFLYLSATVLVLWLTASQIAAVLAAVFEPDRRWARVVNLGFFWGIISIMGALLFSGAARLAWQPKRQWIRALALWPLFATAVVLLILRIAAGSHVPAIESASFWLATAAAAVIITTGVTGCVEWVRHQLRAPEPTG